MSEQKQQQEQDSGEVRSKNSNPSPTAAAEGKRRNRKPKASKAKKGPMELPEFLLRRLKVWERIQGEREVEEQKKPVEAEKTIRITLGDGKIIERPSGSVTPLDIANSISKSLAKRVVVAKVNDELFDLSRPLTEDCTLELLDFHTEQGRHVFWHSSAHILGQVLELYFPTARLCIGPPLDDGGFYYDVHLEGETVNSEIYNDLEKLIKKVTGEKQRFERLELTKEEALELFADNPFKLEIIQKKVPDGEMCSAYRCGPLVDLCRGPHLPTTGHVKSMGILKHSGSYWLGDQNNPRLQRVYGISFPTTQELREYREMLRMAANRDHRKIGMAQRLFFFNEISPGSCFFLPHGAMIYNKLVDFMRQEYLKRGYQEVITPNVYNVDLWKQSGHFANYKDNMFMFDCEGVQFGIKPMNCPGHCVMFGSFIRSYRDLPVRWADFGVLHRNEASGALSGLTRVRRFQQDDAHIFCRRDQLREEVSGVLDLLRHTYGVFGFTFELQLSTRPEKYLGEMELWDEAELALADCLDEFGEPWTINAADGAFYGPKIDIKLTDALRRKHQCATIQLDFQLPIRFNLQYKDSDNEHRRPVIIHRAIFGSVERMIAVLTEHTGGKWPFWISPRQICVVPLTHAFDEPARALCERIRARGYLADFDDSDNQMKKKVFNAQAMQYNYVLVYGAAEQETGILALRPRGEAGDAKSGRVVKLTEEQMYERFAEEVAQYK